MRISSKTREDREYEEHKCAEDRADHQRGTIHREAVGEQRDSGHE